MKLVYTIVAACLLSGCIDDVVSEANVGEPYVEQRKRSGHGPGLCYTMMPGFDGSMKAQFKFSPFCPCSYPAKVEVQKVEWTLESGKVRSGERVKELKKLGACK